VADGDGVLLAVMSTAGKRLDTGACHGVVKLICGGFGWMDEMRML